MATPADWLEERLGARPVLDFFRHKAVPRLAHSYVYYFGGITLFFFLIQVLTGLLLLLYYRPTADAAYESVLFISSHVRFGWLVRSIHAWSANLMVFWVFAHMFGTLFVRAFRRPRELTWISGAVLLLITLTFGFTGYLLPWNKLAFFATKVGTEITGDIPVVGKALMVLLRGGEEITEGTLSRFFGIHVAILPAIVTVVLGLHLYLIQMHGMSGGEHARGKPLSFYPQFVMRDLFVWVLLLGLVSVLATLSPWPIGEKADPLAPAPAGIKPEWYFLFMFETLKVLPTRILGLEGEQVGVVLFALGGLALFLIPFGDALVRRRPWILTVVAAAVLAFIVVMTATGLRGGP